MSCCLLVELGAAQPPDLAGGFQPGIALGPDGGSAAGELIGRGDVADRAVQPDGVVVLDPAGHQRARLVERLGLTRPNSIGLEGLVSAFDLAVRLRVVRRGPDMGHAGEANELLEVLGDKLRPLSEMMRGRSAGYRS